MGRNMVKQRRGGGKTKKVTAQIKQDILEQMAQGQMLTDLCDKHNISRSGVWRARQIDEAFDSGFKESASVGILSFLDQARKNLENADSRDEILKRKEILRHAEWFAEKRLAMFQPTQKSEVTVDGPMVIGWQEISQESVSVSNQVNSRARKSIDFIDSIDETATN